MNGDEDCKNDDRDLPALSGWPDLVQKIRERTPARIFVKRGPAYSTRMGLELRRAHAGAVDAVWSEFSLEKDFSPEFIAQWKLFQVSSRAEAKPQFLLHPDLGRQLSPGGKSLLEQRCTPGPDFQVVLGDGLSRAALAAQSPRLLPLLQEHANQRGWSFGQPFAVRYCRVGIMNEIGDLLSPRLLVLLIGERPGLATAESLSAYMAYRPRSGQSDADRNLISNIHARGVSPDDAALRIVNLAAQMMAAKLSGTTIKEASGLLP